MTDPISDMLTRIRNIIMVRKTEVMVPYSRLKANLADILVHEGYLKSFDEVAAPYRSLRLQLSYDKGQVPIRSLKRISKPGRRFYVKSSELPKVLSGLGIAIISTSQGLMTNREARAKSLGGEVICEIY
jgi:small subunit ribosomal protein S8